MEFLENKTNSDVILKILVIGEIKTGKSLFIQRLTNLDDYEFKRSTKSYNETIGLEFNIKYINFNNTIFKLQFWDTSGQERFNTILRTFFEHANVILIFFDAEDRNSFERAKNIYKEKCKEIKNATIILIRSKYGNSKKEFINCISDEEALEFVDRNKISFAHICCFEKYETGIKELITLILTQYLRKNKLQ